MDRWCADDIESGGYARECVRRCQEMRKDLGHDIVERVRVELDEAGDRGAALVGGEESRIAEEVRSDEFGACEDGHRKEWDIEGVDVEIAVEPLAAPEASD